jgi:hypothetical protein
MIQNLEENKINILPLNENSQSVLIPNFLRKETEFIKNEFSEFVNFSIYQEMINNNSDMLNFTETVEILRMYININDFLQPPIFFISTIYKILLKLSCFIEESEKNFALKENLLSLQKLVENFPMLVNIIKINSEDKDAKKCLALIEKISEKITDKNEKLSNVSIEKIIFYVNAYKRLEKLENKKEINYKIKNSKLLAIESSNKLVESEPMNNSPLVKNQDLDLALTNKTTFDYPNKNVQSNKSQHQPLVAKTKKYNFNHFERKSFIEKFLICSSVKESVIHENLSKITKENFQNKSKDYYSILDYLDFSRFRKLITECFPGHNIYLIGSCRTGLLIDIEGRRTTIDMLLLPDVYERNSFDKPVSFQDFVKSLGSLEKIIKKLNSLNTLQTTYEFMNLNNIKDEDSKNLFFNFDIKNKKKSHIPSINVNFIIYDEKLKVSSDLIGKFFYKNEVLQSLHMFFQEILISKLKLLNTRRDLSNLIMAFLDKREKIFHHNQINKKCYFLRLKERDSPYFKSSSLVLDQYYCTRFDVQEKFKKEFSLSMSLGELVLEFLRFFLNYVQYIKNDFNKNYSKNFISCKGFEYLDQEYREYKDQKLQSYVLDHDCMLNIYNVPKVSYDNQFCKQVELLEEVYFKLVECSDKIISFKHLLENVKQI